MQFSQDFPSVTSVSDWPILICLLGNFRLLKGGQPILLHRAGKTQSLLSNLALGPDYALPRERLLQAVWPDTDVALAGQSLNSLVHALRKQLSDHLDGAPPVVETDGQYRLNIEAGVGLDVNGQSPIWLI